MLMERHCVDKPANGLNLILFEQVHHRRKEGKYINGFGLGESIHVDSIAGTMGSCVVVRKGVYSPVGCFTTGGYFYTKKRTINIHKCGRSPSVRDFTHLFVCICRCGGRVAG